MLRSTSLPVPVVPPILPDELAASYWKRIQDLNLIAAPRHQSGSALGAPWREMLVALPFNLSKFCSTTATYAGLSDETVLLEHTLYGLYASGVGAPRQEALRKRMLSPSRGPRFPVLPFGFEPISSRAVSTCKMCEAQNSGTVAALARFRIHNIPGISLCLVHMTPLTAGTGYPLAAELSGMTFDDRAISNELRVAHAAREILSMKPPDLARLRPELQARFLAYAGPLTSRRRAIGTAARLIRQTFKDGFCSNAVTRLVVDEASVDKALRKLLDARGSCHPFWISVFHSVVPAEFRDRAPAGGNAKHSERKPNQVELTAVLKKSASLEAVSLETGDSITTLTAVARRNSMEFPYRRSKLTDESRRGALTRVAGGCPIARVASDLNMSTSSVYRLLATAPEVLAGLQSEQIERTRDTTRSAWISGIQANPGLSRTELRRESQRIWAWLYRNDRDWLKESTAELPPAHRSQTQRLTPRHSPERVQSMRRALEDAKERALNVARARRVTTASLLRSAGISAAVGKDTGGLHTFAAGLAETLAEFVGRRLHEAARGLNEIGVHLSPSALLRSANLRPSTLQQADIDASDWISRFQSVPKNAP
jgi:hypothetical protein